MGKEPLAAIREREIYARIDRILCHKHIEFALEHQSDSLEQLTEYLKACTDDLGHLPRKCEVIGGEFIALRFGSWEAACKAAYLCPPVRLPKLINTARYNREKKVQEPLVIAEHEEKKKLKRQKKAQRRNELAQEQAAKRRAEKEAEKSAE